MNIPPPEAKARPDKRVRWNRQNSLKKNAEPPKELVIAEKPKMPILKKKPTPDWLLGNVEKDEKDDKDVGLPNLVIPPPDEFMNNRKGKVSCVFMPNRLRSSESDRLQSIFLYPSCF